jgi:hypothetical protein
MIGRDLSNSVSGWPIECSSSARRSCSDAIASGIDAFHRRGCRIFAAHARRREGNTAPPLGLRRALLTRRQWTTASGKTKSARPIVSNWLSADFRERKASSFWHRLTLRCCRPPLPMKDHASVRELARTWARVARIRLQHRFQCCA